MSDVESLDDAVDAAVDALKAVMRIADRHGAPDLRRLAGEAVEGLLDAWERAE